MDGRDLLVDGWPQIPEHYRLPLLRLLEGAARTARFIKAASEIRCDDQHRVMRRGDIARERDAVTHELPEEWLAAPVRRNRLDSRAPP